jgi:hypothetical protein
MTHLADDGPLVGPRTGSLYGVMSADDFLTVVDDVTT